MSPPITQHSRDDKQTNSGFDLQVLLDFNVPSTQSQNSMLCFTVARCLGLYEVSGEKKRLHTTLPCHPLPTL